MLDKTLFESLLDEALGKNGVDLADIPNIDLYMDQVTTLMERMFAGYKREPGDKIFTKAMINNYTKAGVLLPPKKKKYSRENVILLLFVYRLKQVLSIPDISCLLGPLTQKPGGATDNSLIVRSFQAFMKLEDAGQNAFRELLQLAEESVDALTLDFPGDDKEILRWMLLAILLASQAEVQKRLAEKIIDRCIAGTLSE